MTRNKFTRAHYKYVDFDIMSKIIGKRLQDIRNAKDMTINMVSLTAGINRNTIRRIENGSSGAELQNIFKLAIALDIPLKELFSEVDFFCVSGMLFNDRNEAAFS